MNGKLKRPQSIAQQIMEQTKISHNGTNQIKMGATIIYESTTKEPLP